MQQKLQSYNTILASNVTSLGVKKMLSEDVVDLFILLLDYGNRHHTDGRGKAISQNF
jgi:hypothetical protein